MEHTPGDISSIIDFLTIDLFGVVVGKKKINGPPYLARTKFFETQFASHDLGDVDESVLRPHPMALREFISIDLGFRSAFIRMTHSETKEFSQIRQALFYQPFMQMIAERTFKFEAKFGIKNAKMRIISDTWKSKTHTFVMLSNLKRENGVTSNSVLMSEKHPRNFLLGTMPDNIRAELTSRERILKEQFFEEFVVPQNVTKFERELSKQIEPDSSIDYEKFVSQYLPEVGRNSITSKDGLGWESLRNANVVDKKVLKIDASGATIKVNVYNRLKFESLPSPEVKYRFWSTTPTSGMNIDAETAQNEFHMVDYVGTDSITPERITTTAKNAGVNLSNLEEASQFFFYINMLLFLTNQ